MGPSSPAPALVAKLGGSLFTLPDLRERLLDLVDRHPGRFALLAGGGAVVDAIRDWHDRFALDEAVSHELAMRALDLTSDVCALLLRRSRCCTAPEEAAAAWETGEVALIRPQAWFPGRGWFDGRPRLPSGLLPKSWEVTSDTLAACAAIDLDADLLLLKSVDLPPGLTIAAAARGQFVDTAFPRVASLLRRVRWINLRTGQESPLVIE